MLSVPLETFVDSTMFSRIDGTDFLRTDTEVLEDNGHRSQKDLLARFFVLKCCIYQRITFDVASLDTLCKEKISRLRSHENRGGHFGSS